jgi:hypothetical protein
MLIDSYLDYFMPQMVRESHWTGDLHGTLTDGGTNQIVEVA